MVTAHFLTDPKLFTGERDLVLWFHLNLFFFSSQFFAFLFFLPHQLVFVHSCPSKGVSG